MEEPELVYCEAIDSEKDVQPPPLPKRGENIAAPFIELNSPGRTPLPWSPIIITANSCQRSENSQSGKTQVALSIAVAIFAINSVVFMSLYFTAEEKPRSYECQHSLPNTSRDDMLCPRIMTNCSGCEKKINDTNNDTGKNTGYHLPFLFSVSAVLYLLRMYSECSQCGVEKIKGFYIMGKIKKKRIRPMFVCDMHCLTQLIEFKNSSWT